MTLQEAHEIQRRELISLRAENKRLQKQASGLFSSEDREALERRMMVTIEDLDAIINRICGAR